METELSGSENPHSVRLQKAIADAGTTSRRKAERLIVDGKVKVNGAIVTTLGTKVNPFVDFIEVDGVPTDPTMVDRIYLLLNKPRGYVTTLIDPEGRKTILDLIPTVKTRVFPVGRLDYLSEGLLILTNDGELANQIMHPSFEVEKIYEVKIFGVVNDYILSSLRRGVWLPEGFAKPKSVRLIKQMPGKTWLEFRLNEGRNREIRRICEAVGVTIDKLKRVAIENVNIENMAPGQFDFITKKKLLQLLGMDAAGNRINHKPFMSATPTQTLKRKYQDRNSLATHRAYQNFRKENYYQTIEKLKDKQPKLPTDPSFDDASNAGDVNYPT